MSFAQAQKGELRAIYSEADMSVCASSSCKMRAQVGTGCVRCKTASPILRLRSLLNNVLVVSGICSSPCQRESAPVERKAALQPVLVVSGICSSPFKSFIYYSSNFKKFKELLYFLFVC